MPKITLHAPTRRQLQRPHIDLHLPLVHYLNLTFFPLPHLAQDSKPVLMNTNMRSCSAQE